MYMLSAPMNTKGQPIAPSCQLCVECVVHTRNRISKQLMQKSWEVYGYKSINDLQKTESFLNNSITVSNRTKIVQIMKSAGGSDTIPSLDGPENEIHDPDIEEEHMDGI